MCYELPYWLKRQACLFNITGHGKSTFNTDSLGGYRYFIASNGTKEACRQRILSCTHLVSNSIICHEVTTKSEFWNTHRVSWSRGLWVFRAGRSSLSSVGCLGRYYVFEMLILVVVISLQSLMFPIRLKNSAPAEEGIFFYVWTTTSLHNFFSSKLLLLYCVLFPTIYPSQSSDLTC